MFFSHPGGIRGILASQVATSETKVNCSENRVLIKKHILKGFGCKQSKTNQESGMDFELNLSCGY